MRGRARHRARLPMLLTLAAAALVALPGSAMAGWDGTQDIGLGDKISAEFGNTDTSVHEFRFYAPAGTTVDVKAKADSGLTLGFELWSDLGVQVDLAGGTSAGFKKIAIPSDGHYLLQVMAASGEGIYDLTTKGKYPKSVTVEGDDDEVHFGALAGSMVQAQVKSAKGSDASATIESLEYPGGEVTMTPGTKVKVASALPVSNTYFFTLTITGTGDVVTQVKVKAPKSKRSWGFGVVEPVVGAPAGIREKWLSSPHNDYASEPFRHWDEDGEISTSCAKCHSSYGYQDWVGADGSAFEVVNKAAALGSTVDCDACHNSGTEGLDTALFPSGIRIDGLGNEARCMQCHQGRSWSGSIQTKIDGKEADTVDTSLSFSNIHYLAAAATLYGADVMGGYQFPDLEYNGRFRHVAEKDTCIECHDVHSTTLKLNDCQVCHPEATDYAGLRTIRMTRTYLDYDGDGDLDEGIAEELDGMAAKVYEAMQAYGVAIGFPIVYDAHAYPYFFYDANGNDALDAGEVGYRKFTPRMLTAAYNYQYSQKDPGTYAHNARYVMELLHDVYEDLQVSGVYKPLSTVLVRNEEGGHFDATSEAYRHWDEDEDVSSSCAQCHTPDGFEFYATYTTATVEQNPFTPFDLPQGMNCESCHVVGADWAGDPERRSVAAVWWPGATTGMANTTNDESFICMTCHQGRESTKTVDDYIASGKKGFRNVHYLPAGGTIYGNDAKVGYQYSDKTYVGKWTHKGDTSFQCTYCHMQEGTHSFKPENGTTCQLCHGATTDIEDFRIKAVGVPDNTDYNGNGNTTEPLKDEVATYAARLLAAIEDYAANTNGVPIVYDSHSYPYWFKATGGSYSPWDETLMKACFNYQYSQKEPGAWAHNRAYIFQLLYDSIEKVGGSTTGLTRP